MEKNKECSLVQNLLNDYINDNLSDDGFDAVREHLKTCEDCTKMYNQMLEEDKKEHKDDDKIKSKDYMKRYNRKYSSLKTILSFLFIVIAIVIMFLLMNYIYETKVFLRSLEAINDLEKEKNLYISVTKDSNGSNKLRTDTFINDNGIKIARYSVLNNGYDALQEEVYWTKKSNYCIMYYNNTYRINNQYNQSNDDNIYESMKKSAIAGCFLQLNYKENEWAPIKRNLKVGLFNRLKSHYGNEIDYIIYDELLSYSTGNYDYSQTDLIINKINNLPIKITRREETEYKMYYENYDILVQKDIVTDKDIALPNLDGFTKIEGM